MTPRRLVLIRHAKAEAHGGDDSQRRLDPRGERDAREIGRWLRDSQHTSGVAVVSPARRTVQTWELAVEELTGAPRTSTDDRIYRNTIDDLFAVIHEAPPQARTLFLVGHNPGIAELAASLDSGEGDRTAATAMATKFPTSAIAVFCADGAWSTLAPGDASLLSFVVPRG